METVAPTTASDPNTELRHALEKLTSGIPFTPTEKDVALARMDRIREENRSLFGETNIAVEIVRQSRDGI